MWTIPQLIQHIYKINIKKPPNSSNIRDRNFIRKLNVLRLHRKVGMGILYIVRFDIWPFLQCQTDMSKVKLSKKLPTPKTIETGVLGLNRKWARASYICSQIWPVTFLSGKSKTQRSNYWQSPIASQMSDVKSYRVLQLNRKAGMGIAWNGSDLTLDKGLGCKGGVLFEHGQYRWAKY